MPEFSLLQSLGFEAAVAALALLFSRWEAWQRRMIQAEAFLSRWSQSPNRCLLSVAAASVLLRILLLPIEPVPIPLFHDEFSFLLGADTFFHGRLTNPTPAVAAAFETIHVNTWPTYQSMYIPGTALLLTLGKLVGCPWVAVLLATATFCATIYWMVSAWLPNPYALAASLIAIGITGNMNWWFDNYFSVALPALGMALVLGSLPRILARRIWQASIPMAIGLLILMLTRPYEGFCVAFPCVLALIWRLRAASSQELASIAAAPVLLLGAGLLWLMYYNWRGTGHPLLFAYMLNFRTYHITGPFIFSARHPLPPYRLDTLRRFYTFAEVPQFEFMHAHPWEYLFKKIWIYYYTYLFGLGTLLVLGLTHLAYRWREGIVLAPLLGFLGFAVNVALMGWKPFPQYAAPAFPLLLMLVTSGLLALRNWNWRWFDGVAVSRGLVLGELMLGFSLLGLRIADSRDFQEPQYVTKDRIRIEKEVLRHPGKQLCLVRYTPGHEAWQEWVFNGADLPNERLIWARSLDPKTDQEVIAAYPGREVWLVQPDFANDLLHPYPMSSVSPSDGPPDAAAGGGEPQPGLGARDVFTEFRLPPVEDTAQDPLWTSIRLTQVVSRAGMFHLNSRSATEAWAAGESTYRDAQAAANVTFPGTPTIFTGRLTSELDALLSRPTVGAVRVDSAELEMDQPIRIARNDIDVDLGSTRLRMLDGSPFQVTIEGAHNVLLRGGSLESGAWGVLVIGSTHITLVDMDIAGLRGGGFLITGSEDVIVWANRIHGLGGAPVLLMGKTDRVTVARNRIFANHGPSNWNAGIVLTDRQIRPGADPDRLLPIAGFWPATQPMNQRLDIPHDNLIVENRIVGNISSGIYSDGSARNLIIGNRIEANSKEGLCLDNGSIANVLAGNTIRGNGRRWGMSDYDLQRDFTYTAGRLADGTSPAKLPGISIDNAAYNQIVLNTVDRNYGGGIKMVRTGFYNIVGLNTIVDNNQGENKKFHFFGVELGAAPADAPSPELDFAPSRGNEIFANQIRGNHYSGIFFADGSDRNNVFDNSIFGANTWALESVRIQANITLNNLTNLRSRNIGSGLQPVLLRIGAPTNDPIVPRHDSH